MKRFLTMVGLMVGCSMLTASWAQADPNCMTRCTLRATNAVTQCNLDYAQENKTCQTWGERRLAVCKFKKLSSREKFCSYTRDTRNKTCEAKAKRGRKQCKANVKECKERAAVFCRTRCSTFTDKEECQKHCTYHRKARCDSGLTACHALVEGAATGCRKHAKQRHRACKRGLKGILCNREAKGYTNRCQDYAKAHQQACAAFGNFMKASCAAYCMYHYH
ncbi:MAG: hypothetical protein EP343_13720 [Deltaproteobacteria bacterium]|nr:MAG: hypothetical protein EP343_13720 [Deltaproteobacteria bacterium]